MTTPTPTDSDRGSTVGTPGRRRQHAAPSQPDLAAKSRRLPGCQERGRQVPPKATPQGRPYSREAGATIIEVRWEGALADVPDPAGTPPAVTAHTTARRQGRRRNQARTPPRSSLRTPTNRAHHSLQRWVEKCDRSVANSETPQPRSSGFAFCELLEFRLMARFKQIGAMRP